MGGVFFPKKSYLTPLCLCVVFISFCCRSQLCVIRTLPVLKMTHWKQSFNFCWASILLRVKHNEWNLVLSWTKIIKIKCSYLCRILNAKWTSLWIKCTSEYNFFAGLLKITKLQQYPPLLSGVWRHSYICKYLFTCFRCFLFFFFHFFIFLISHGNDM